MLDFDKKKDDFIFPYEIISVDETAAIIEIVNDQIGKSGTPQRDFIFIDAPRLTNKNDLISEAINIFAPCDGILIPTQSSDFSIDSTGRHSDFNLCQLLTKLDSNGKGWI